MQSRLLCFVFYFSAKANLGHGGQERIPRLQVCGSTRGYELQQRETEESYSHRGSPPGRWEARGDRSLEKALLRLEEEHQRCEDLAEANTLVQKHLDQVNVVNSALQEDTGKLVADWMRAQEELELKESEWRADRELHDSYVRGEQNHLLSLWRQVVTLRHHCLEMKTAIDRDLSELKAEQMRLSGSLLVSCSCLNSGTQLWESITARRPVLKDEAQPQVEQDISPKTWEVMCLQVTGDLEKTELQHRLKDLAALEGKHFSFQTELVVARETLEGSHLQSDLLKQEKHQLAPTLEKVYRQQESASSAREQLRQESSRQGHALAKASKEKKLLVQEKAALELRLAAMEWDRQGLSEQLAEARCFHLPWRENGRILSKKTQYTVMWMLFF
ncbi:centrosome-associated protein CEP250-like [Opisthocomus hoazin]|uniref:centrosome-associated protein CEP250-like n=1 Tax=Opisthocomus hoazin TaxID=30419 RepID=UPI003F52C46C